jgi:hypothetical protein
MARASGVGGMNLVFIQFYKLRTLTEEEKRSWFSDWAKIKEELPKDLKFVTESPHAFGTDFTGFTVLEGSFEDYQSYVEIMDKKSSHVVEKTKTIIGTKDLLVPTGEFQRILESRPID